MRTPSFLRLLLDRTKRHAPTVSPITDLPQLILAAGKLAQLLKSGHHKSRRSGNGEDFWQFRPHMPHEPASHIDWKQSARSPDATTLWVREREQRTSRQLLLWVDPSASMLWQSDKHYPIKKDAALTALLALGQAALQAGESVGVLGSRRCYNGPQNVPRLAYDLTHISSSIPNLTHAPPHAHVILASDFLWPDHNLDVFFTQAQHRQGITALLGIFDPQEYHLSSYTGRLRFTSNEDTRSLTLPAVETLQNDYQDHIQHHIARLSRREKTITSSHTTRHPSAHFMLHLTNQSMWPALLALHNMLGGKK